MAGNRRQETKAPHVFNRDPSPSGGTRDADVDSEQSESLQLREIYQEFEQPLLRYCVSLTKDLHHSQEVIQETFLKLAQQANRPVGAHLQAWLFRVCRNQIIDQRRRQKKMKTQSLQNHILSSNTASPESVASMQETKVHVMHLISGLPSKQQEALRLKFQNNMSYRQIAEVMGETTSNVGVLLHTALGKLRSRVGIAES